MADPRTSNLTESDLPLSEKVLLSILCCFDNRNLPMDLIHHVYLSSGGLPATPDARSFEEDLRTLLRAGRINTSQTIPNVAFKIEEDVRAAIIQSMTGGERLAAFNTAVKLLSSTWPFIDSFNVTQTERLITARQYMPHVIALRHNCLDLVLAGFMPDMEICALLHEEAWFQIMQTTVDDMHLRCFYDGLPLAAHILNSHRANLNQARLVEINRLYMKQCRVESISASMLGNKGEAVDKRLSWIGRLYGEIEEHGLMEDYRTIPVKQYEIGMTELHCGQANDRAGIEKSQEACSSIELLQGLGGEYRWAMPHITLALMRAQCDRNYDTAEEILQPLLMEHTQKDGYLFDDMSSLQTGVILYAMGTVKYLRSREGSTAALHEALGFLLRAERVLTSTHGEEALWTLAATYRMAVCLYDLGEHEMAIRHLQKINLAFGPYNFRHLVGHDGGADTMWQKARAMWKLGVVLRATGHQSVEDEAAGLISGAVQIYDDLSGPLCYEDRSGPLEALINTIGDNAWDNNILPLYR